MRKLLIALMVLATTHLYGQDTLQRLSIHAQQTFVEQYHPSFRSSVGIGDKSLYNTSENTLSSVTTLYFGVRLWKYAEVYVNPEVAGGSGFSGACGVAGFPNGTTFRVGSPAPSVYIGRFFFRQTISLGKEKKQRGGDFNKISMMIPTERIVITFGKFSLSDIFDQNVTSHDPTTSLLNWSLMDAGAWDYPSNTRGYTYALSIKTVKKQFILRFCSAVNALWSNGLVTEGFIPSPSDWANAHGELLELTIPIKKDFSNSIKLTGFANHGRMAAYASATKSLLTDTSLANREVVGTPTSLNDTTSHLVSPALDKQRGRGGPYYGKFGFIISWEMKLGKKDEMIFARASWNDGKRESWMYTEIDESLAFGGFISGSRFKRPDDIIRLGFAINGISKDHANYLKAGGYGFIVGDGLGNYPNGISPEIIFEAQYNFKYKFLTLSPDYQFIVNPAYNSARGPVHALGLRVHFEI